MRAIIDDLSGRKDVSRQRLHQIRKVRLGKCQICTKPKSKRSASYCAKHMIIARERQRKKGMGRYMGAKSYQFT